jgi:hypothetical protein
MGKNDRWIYGEFVRKQWGVSERTFATIVYDNGIQAYDVNNERLDVDEASGSFSDGLKFKLDDIEEFELQNEHLIKKDKNIGNTIIETKSNTEDELGKRMTAKEVAEKINVDVKTVRANYHELGGMRLGRQYVFFERRLNNAIQERTEMDCPSEERGAETGEGISDEEGSVDMGSQNEAKTRRRVEQEDRHGLFG